MNTDIRTGFAIASVLILAACAATTPDTRPSVGATPAIAQNRDCTAAGRSYSREDIDRTGATTADEALRLMDPSITVHR
jgi:hypothetical protein